MTKLLDQAIEAVSKLSAEEQDRIAAEIIDSVTAAAADVTFGLSDEQLKQLQRRRADTAPRNIEFPELEARMRRLRA